MSSSEIIGIMDKSNSKSIKNELRTVQMHNNAISKISRYELEDLYVRLHDENINLKTKNNTNEKKLQKLAVRVIRLSKNSNEKEDVEIEDYDNAMKNARKLQKYNVELTKQLNLLKKEKVRPYRTLNKTLTKKPNNQQILQSRITRELVIDELEQKIVNLQKSEKHITQEFDIKENEYQNDIHNLKKQMNNTNRKNFNENINLIKLQREIKEKGTKLIALQQKYGELQKKQEILHNNHNGLIHELDRATEALNEEQRKVSKYQESIKKLDIKSIKLQEMEDRILEIENENSVLRDANKNMVSSAFNMDREREWQKREKILKVQIAQLEATLRSDNSEKGCVLDQLIQSKDELSKQTDQHNKLKAEYFQLKHEYEEQKQKLDYLNKNCDQWDELDDTIMVVNMKKMENGKVTEEKKMDYRKTIKCLRIEHAETILELEKTRNMLIVQNKILKSYQKEIDTIKNKFNIEKETSDEKIHEMSYLLDMRAIRLKKLQKQIRDIAYGTKTTKIKELDELLVDSETDKIDDGSKSYNLDLDRGDNLIEFKLCSINLNTDMTKLMDDEAPLLFCTWDFYEFDTQVSKVVCGTNSAINCCSNYIVKIDAFAIQYLFDSCISIQMYHLLGTQCKLLAIGNVPIIDLFKQSDKIVRCTTNLVCHENGEIVGELDYTLRMKYAMEHSLRLFNEKTKAQTYIENMQHNDIEKYENLATSKIPLEKSKITISILSCHNIKSKNDIQPNLYAGYQFYTFKEHLTNKINSSENPEFNDSCSFTIDNNTRFSNYIQNQKLQIYLIDDNSNIKDEYVCMAHVDVKDIFEKEELYHKIALKDSNNCDCGTIEIYIRLSDLSDINLTEFDKASSKNESIYIDNRNNDTQLNCDQVIAVSPKVPSLSIHSEIPSQDLLGNFDRHSKISISSEKNKKAYIMTKSISSDFKVQYNHAESKNESVTNKSYRNESDSHGEVEIETFDNVMKNNNEKDLLHKLGSYSVDELNKKRIDSDKNSFLSERSHNKSKLSNTIVPPTKSLSKPSKVYSNVSNENDNISAKSRTTSENQSEKSVSKIRKLSGYKSDIKDKKSTPNMSNKSDKSVKSTKSVIDIKKTHQISDNTVDNINNKDENGSEISEYSETKSKSKSKSKTNSKYSDKNSVNKSKISIDVNDADDVENKNYAKSNISTRTRSIHSSRESISSIEKTTEITESPLNVSPRINRRKTLQPSSGNITPSSEDENLNIHIVIHRLVISPDSYIMQNAKIKNVFVCYDLLDVLSEETETDLTLTKSSDNAMIYNFDKKYTYNQNDLENKKKLYNMIFVENKMVQFTVVSEPETDGECIDVAYGHVNLSDVLQSDKEIIEQPLKLYEIMDGESTNKVTATLYITVKCLKLLSWIKELK